MNTESSEGAFYATPTLMQRLRRWLGFRYHHADEPPNLDPKKHKGWMKTTTVFQFDFADRLRLLTTGRLKIDIDQHTTRQVDAVSSASYQIFAPFQDVE